jgi:hypothetical protein
MKALQIRNAQTMRIAVQQEIGRSDESRYDHRLHGVLLVCQGHSCYDVGEWLGEHPTTIERWVHRFEGIGFNGLREGPREGLPRAKSNGCKTGGLEWDLLPVDFLRQIR